MERKIHILLIEDDVSVRDIMQSKLSKEGFLVSIAVNGLHALQMMRSDSSFDVIVSNLKMPGKSGMEVLEEAKKQQIHSPFIMLTDNPEVSEMAEALRDGAQEVLLKPVRHAELLEKINACLTLFRIAA